MAQGLVSHKTAKFAQGLLNDTSPTYLASVATWADSYRYTKGGEFSAIYHYIDARKQRPCEQQRARLTLTLFSRQPTRILQH
jgi:hypothetical protein